MRSGSRHCSCRPQSRCRCGVQEQDARGLEFPILVGGRRSTAISAGARHSSTANGLCAWFVLCQRMPSRGSTSWSSSPFRRGATSGGARAHGSLGVAQAPGGRTVQISRRTAREWLDEAPIPRAPFFRHAHGARFGRERVCGRISTCAVSTGCRGVARASRVRSGKRSCATSSSRASNVSARSRSGRRCCSRKSCTATSRWRATATTSSCTIRRISKWQLARLTFARQSGGQHLCLADYVHPLRPGGEPDVVRSRSCTVGRRLRAHRCDAAARRLQRLVFLARLLGPGSRGAGRAHAPPDPARTRRLRTSTASAIHGATAACPDLAQHEIVWRLLDAERAIGTELTSCFE